jgi:hypothetical protein
MRMVHVHRDMGAIGSEFVEGRARPHAWAGAGAHALSCRNGCVHGA